MPDLRWRDLSQHEGPATPPEAQRERYPEDAPTPCRHSVVEYDERGWGTCRLCWQPVPR